jgi:DNA-binding winged helix-turn-helix (wHTH) protein/ATP/maltotriose-dependent transcriptional regulator MalT
MKFSFGRFELDQRARTLQLDGAERALQPLVFDLLVYLVQHRERVVPKDELLTQLWDGATVTDGSLQRAISLLRGVLRDGGMEHAVQTFARRGYRFSEASQAGEVPPIVTSSTPPPTDEAGLAARALADAGEWEHALAAFAALPATAALSGRDWEAWGNAAQCAGRPEQAVAPLEGAVAAFEVAGERAPAAHAALLLSNIKLEARELAIAKGWHQRALSFLKGEPECKAHGLAEWLASRLALFEARLDDCRAHARAAMEIADRIGDPDLHVLGLIYQGHILIAQGQVRHGLSLHDEAGAAALAGRVSPWVCGIVFCSVIWAYLHLGDHHRAGQWTDEFTRWCERHASYCYPALCRLHRGEVLAIRGELGAAEQEVLRAREQLASSGPFCEGDACRVLGEIRLARGDLDGADAAFREAHRLGWNPQPGLSLVVAARGDAPGALKLLDRALTQPTWTDGQRRGSMLAVVARIAAMNGQLERAGAALAELDGAPELTASGAIEAERTRARGELAFARGEQLGAELELRQSIKLWLELGAPLNAADVRLRLAEVLLTARDTTTAELELSAAEVTFRQADAKNLLAHVEKLARQIRSMVAGSAG